jgi:SAM-dependent methyltransferase
MYYLTHIGDKYECNICNKSNRSFIKTETDKLCPRCGSIQRTRRLWQLLSDEFLKDDIMILDFSPSRSIYRVMKKGDFSYVSSDLSGDFISDKAYNIKDIDSADETYDLIICYHILEHIDEDEKAMRELWRVLKKDGYCLIQTPYKDGEIYEDETIKTMEDRKVHFGQSDHVRIYSVNGLKNRLENVGFLVEVRDFVEDDENNNGFSVNETVLVCYKAD